ncbi:RusA family crossover junction endodeoxyribonuclease [Embleya sp. AB8]|uniref:RusA family crossover junction endodeoxyribonuclease n=1 Tax=Embleya sp. AB8 TaxID=3156304 RepID=UPI003C70E6D4
MAVEQAGGPSDDDETAYVWVCVPVWSPQRAFLTKADPFIRAAGVPVDALSALTERVFVADLDVDDPPDTVGSLGERLTWPRLCATPRIPQQAGPRMETGATVATGALLSVAVHGTPAPQGSKRHVGAGRMIDSSVGVRPWREAVVWAVRQEINRRRGQGPWTPLTGPLEASIVFTVRRPKGHFGTGRNAGVLRASAPLRPHVIPDLDKLLRSTGDAITTAGGYVDDAQIVGYRRAEKRYATDYGRVPDVLATEGAVIRLYRVEDTRPGSSARSGDGS